MNLISTSEELKSNLSSIDKDFKIVSLQSFIDDAEKDILVPWIGQALYDAMLAAYNAKDVAISGKKAVLLPYLQKAVTHLAFLLSADSGSFRISDSGFYVISTDKNKPVSDKKMTEFKRGRREAGYKALEQAVIFLEANIADPDFATYASSDEHRQHNAYFINTSVSFTRYFKKVNNSAYLFWQLQDALDFAERTHLVPVLGQAYFDRLKSNALSAALTAAEQNLVPYICRALVNHTMAKAIPELAVEYDGTNLVVKSEPTTGHFDVAESRMPASSGQLGTLLSSTFNTAVIETRNLEDYLVANAANLTGYMPPDPDEDFDINSPDSPTLLV